MNIYICLKSVTLYGVQYEPGDVIPSAAVLPTRIRALKNQGVIIESSLLMMQALDNRKAINAAIRAQEKGGAL